MAVSTTVDVKVPKRSGFDKSFQNLFTTKVGTLTPILVDELIPNSVVNLDAAISASLPPLASDTFMRCDLKLEAFFVPSRILYGGFEDWVTGNEIFNVTYGDFTKVNLPHAKLHVGGYESQDEADADYKIFYGPGTLLDYLGFKYPKIDASSTWQNANTDILLNIFPLLAYHRIYDDWYRNTQVQTPLFARPTITSIVDSAYDIGNLPYISEESSSILEFDVSTAFSDGVRLCDLRQRNYGMDYFTTATPNPQMGSAQEVTFNVTDSEGAFTISALRAANSLQQFAERNALAGKRLQDYVSAHYGAKLSSGVAQRSIYLGSETFTVYSKGISQTAEVSAGSTNNPFNSVGAQYGRAVSAGEGSLIDHFEVSEPGYLMVLCSLVPKVTYGSGVDRIMTRYGENFPVPTEMADPLLQNVGNQPIFGYELNAINVRPSARGFVFGYTDRFAEWKTKQDQVHGLLRDGESLESFALQRTFNPAESGPMITSNFLAISTSYLDQVAAVSGDISKYGLWCDSFLKYHVSMPLAEYSIPSLQDPAYEHGNDVKIDIRGSRL